MNKRRWAVLTIALTLVAGSSCRSLAPGAAEWQDGPPPNEEVWARVIPFFRVQSVPPTVALAELQKQANALPGPRVSLTVERSVGGDERRVSANLENVRLFNAIRYFAEKTGTHICHRGRDVRFYHLNFLIDGEPGPCAVVHGRAVDASTGKPLDWILVVPTPAVPSVWAGQQVRVHDSSPQGFYAASLVLPTTPVNQEWDSPAPAGGVFVEQFLHLDISRPGYSWQSCDLAIDPTNSRYRVDVELTPTPSISPSMAR
jgi:hypothetical protein